MLLADKLRVFFKSSPFPSKQPKNLQLHFVMRIRGSWTNHASKLFVNNSNYLSTLTDCLGNRSKHFVGGFKACFLPEIAQWTICHLYCATFPNQLSLTCNPTNVAAFDVLSWLTLLNVNQNPNLTLHNDDKILLTAPHSPKIDKL